MIGIAADEPYRDDIKSDKQEAVQSNPSDFDVNVRQHEERTKCDHEYRQAAGQCIFKGCFLRMRSFREARSMMASSTMFILLLPSRSPAARLGAFNWMALESE